MKPNSLSELRLCAIPDEAGNYREESFTEPVLWSEEEDGAGGLRPVHFVVTSGSLHRDSAGNVSVSTATGF